MRGEKALLGIGRKVTLFKGIGRAEARGQSVYVFQPTCRQVSETLVS